MKPLLSIWISPLKTFSYLAERGEKENRPMVNLIYALTAIAIGIPRLKEVSALFENHKYIGVIIGIFLFGVVGLTIVKYLFALIYWVSGKMLKGEATIKQVQLVVAYSLVPVLIYLVIGLVLIVPAIVTHNFEIIFYRHPFTYYVVSFLCLRNLIYGLSYFNKFAYGYGLLTVLIPSGIVVLIRQIILFWKL